VAFTSGGPVVMNLQCQLNLQSGAATHELTCHRSSAFVPSTRACLHQEEQAREELAEKTELAAGKALSVGKQMAVLR
jgi:hypothetical protein